MRINCSFTECTKWPIYQDKQDMQVLMYYYTASYVNRTLFLK